MAGSCDLPPVTGALLPEGRCGGFGSWWVSAAGTGGSRSIPREQPSLEAVQMLTGALGMQLALAPWWGRGLLAVGSWRGRSPAPPLPALPFPAGRNLPARGSEASRALLLLFDTNPAEKGTAAAFSSLPAAKGRLFSGSFPPGLLSESVQVSQPPDSSQEYQTGIRHPSAARPLLVAVWWEGTDDHRT